MLKRNDFFTNSKKKRKNRCRSRMPTFALKSYVIEMAKRTKIFLYHEKKLRKKKKKCCFSFFFNAQ